MPNRYVILGTRPDPDVAGQVLARVRMFLNLPDESIIKQGRDPEDFDKSGAFVDEDFIVPIIPVIVDPVEAALRKTIEDRMTTLAKLTL